MNCYFDTHCHLDFKEFDEGRGALITKWKALGVKKFVVPATSYSALAGLEELADKYEGVYIGAGIHPFFVNEESLRDVDRLGAYLQCSPSVDLVALGEMGLDKFCGVDYELQKEVLSKQLRYAKVFNLPVILHCRKGYSDLLRLLDFHDVRSGVVHGFTGSYEIACEFMKRRFLIGLGGAVTWGNASKVRNMVSRLGIDSIVFETDSPDMSPEWLKGQCNTPESVIHVGKYVAELLGIEESTVAMKVYRNSCDLFGLETD